jgi:hypothetical protein
MVSPEMLVSRKILGAIYRNTPFMRLRRQARRAGGTQRLGMATGRRPLRSTEQAGCHPLTVTLGRVWSGRAPRIFCGTSILRSRRDAPEAGERKNAGGSKKQ